MINKRCILHICSGMAWRGGDSQMLTIVELLSSENDQSHIVLCPENSEVEKRCRERNLRYISVPRGSKISLSYVLNIIKVSKSEKVLALHAHDSSGLTMALLAKTFLKNKKLIYIRKRNNRISSNLFKKIKYNSSNITNILCVSKAVEKVLQPIIKDHSKIEVIYDGIDVEKYTQATDKDYVRKLLKLNPDAKIVGTLAGLVPQKDIHTFIKAAAYIKKELKSEVKFVIAGDGPLLKELMEFAALLKMEHDIFFLGFRNDGPQLLKGFDVLMLSSKTEGLPLVILEAFATRTPVVSTDAGGVDEGVTNEINGFIVPVENDQALAKRALQVLNDENLANTFTQKSEKLVREKFTLDVMKSNYKKFYNKL
ncbi:glycosyltransferase family 4 protein [Leeuwenhoekiella sp. NPDC079379]|uniref:glycosyltransferase family 4 protein n=1 Tax=Leeuwenhoekiella sp. NPDC079379 TaxID=3364122 RepID=UPI0037CA7B4F